MPLHEHTAAPLEEASQSASSADSRADSYGEEAVRSSFVVLVHQMLGEGGASDRASGRTSSFSNAGDQDGFDVAPRQAAVPPPENIGGRFKVRRPIGSGGFGTVYLAHDETLDRDVAIKVPHEKLKSDPQLSAQCLKEARLAAKLRHASIVTIFDVHEEAGRIEYIVQEYIQGVTLHELSAEKRLSIKQAIHLVLKVAEAIQFAHVRGVYHRDLKPANLIVDETGGIRVLDFGLAVDEEMQRSSKGQIAGTLAYMSPEQVQGKTHHLDGRTDIWSLGVIFYELLTGRRPFRGTQEEISDQVIRREAAPPRQFLPTIPKRVESCCLKCLAKSIPDRYATALDLVEDLKSILETEDLPDDSPDSPLPATLPHDTKKLARDTTKEIPGRRSWRWMPWWIFSVCIVLTFAFILMMSRIWEGQNSLVPEIGEPGVPAGVSGRTLNLLSTKPRQVIAPLTEPYFNMLAGGQLTLQSNNVLAVLFDEFEISDGYSLQIDVGEIPDWEGSFGAMLGFTRSKTQENKWLGYVLDVAQDVHDGKWNLFFSHVVLDESRNQIVSTAFISKVPLEGRPEGIQLLEIRVNNGILGAVVLAGRNYPDITVNIPENNKRVCEHCREHQVPARLLDGKVGIMIAQSNVVVHKIVLKKISAESNSR